MTAAQVSAQEWAKLCDEYDHACAQRDALESELEQRLLEEANKRAELLEALSEMLELIDQSNLGEKAWRERESKMVNRARALLEKLGQS